MADDDVHVRRLWTRALRDAGYAIIEAADGLDTVNAIRFLLPDLVVLDLHMPQLTGAEVLATIRNSPLVRRIPVLVVSGHLAEEHRHRELGLNIIGELTKPIDVTTLVQRVQAALPDDASGASASSPFPRPS